MLTLNQELLDKARAVLWGRTRLFWIVGGACAGKSTICRALAEQTDASICDMDERIYGSYMGRYDPQRHLAATAWFSAPNPLAWALSLSWEEFDALNRALDAEYLDLLADDLAGSVAGQPLLVDGGFTHPAVLAQVVLSARIACLAVPDADAARIWETSEDRAEMRQWIRALPNPDAMWQKFLSFDRGISRTMGQECEECHIKTFLRSDRTSIGELAGLIRVHFGL